MRPKNFLRIKRFFLIMLRNITRPLATAPGIGMDIYCWADLHIYKIGKVYLLPEVIYVFLVRLCNAIASFNTVGYCKLRCKWLQRTVDWVIHRIPDEIRFA
jgi:hypothetical protein